MFTQLQQIFQYQNFRLGTFVNEISLKIYQILQNKLKSRRILQCDTTKSKSQKEAFQIILN